jgi:hypothetical protein
MANPTATAREVKKRSVSRCLYDTQNRNPLKRCGDNLCSVEWSGIPCQPRPSLRKRKTDWGNCTKNYNILLNLTKHLRLLPLTKQLYIVYGARDINSHRGRIAQDRDRTNGKRIMYFILKFMHNYKAVATKLAKLSFSRFLFI